MKSLAKDNIFISLSCEILKLRLGVMVKEISGTSPDNKWSALLCGVRVKNAQNVIGGEVFLRHVKRRIVL